jgi:hypothetical protein
MAMGTGREEITWRDAIPVVRFLGLIACVFYVAFDAKISYEVTINTERQ